MEFSTAVNENGLNSVAPQNSQVTQTRQSPHRREVSSHVLNEGVIRTIQRQQGLREPEPHVSSERLCVSLHWIKKMKGQRVCCMPESRSAASCQLPEKAAFGRNSDAAWQNIKHCLLLLLLHPSPSSVRWNIIPLSHLTRIYHMGRWSLHSHMHPWDFHKWSKEGMIRSAWNSLGTGSATGVYESWDGEGNEWVETEYCSLRTFLCSRGASVTDVYWKWKW